MADWVLGGWRGGEVWKCGLEEMCKVWLVVGEGKMWYDGE